MQGMFVGVAFSGKLGMRLVLVPTQRPFRETALFPSVFRALRYPSSVDEHV
jgi:hypothetical protein